MTLTVLDIIIFIFLFEKWNLKMTRWMGSWMSILCACHSVIKAELPGMQTNPTVRYSENTMKNKTWFLWERITKYAWQNYSLSHFLPFFSVCLCLDFRERRPSYKLSVLRDLGALMCVDIPSRNTCFVKNVIYYFITMQIKLRWERSSLWNLLFDNSLWRWITGSLMDVSWRVLQRRRGQLWEWGITGNATFWLRILSRPLAALRRKPILLWEMSSDLKMLFLRLGGGMGPLPVRCESLSLAVLMFTGHYSSM